jgi:hypothetical protein
MVTISIIAEAYAAIRSTLPQGAAGRLEVLGIPASPVLFEPSDRFVVDPRLCFGLCYEFVNVDLFAMRKGNPHVPFRLGFHLDRLEFSFGLRTRHRLIMGRDGQSR